MHVSRSHVDSLSNVVSLSPTHIVLHVRERLPWSSAISTHLALATPSRANEIAWAHVNDRELAASVARAKTDLDEMTTDPCTFCGSTALASDFHRNAEGMCHRCDRRLGSRFGSSKARRDYAAAVSWASTRAVR